MFDIEKEPRPWDLLNPNIPNVPKSVAEERYALCKSCEYFFKGPNICRKCGCGMGLKVTLPHSYCPVNKWKKYYGEEKSAGDNV